MLGHDRLQEGLDVIDLGLSPSPRREGMSERNMCQRERSYRISLERSQGSAPKISPSSESYGAFPSTAIAVRRFNDGMVFHKEGRL
jgi:hypothetical protein